MSQLKELDEEEFRQLCLMVGMASKPFHVKRLQKALGRPSSQIYSTKLSGASSSPAPTLTTSAAQHTPSLSPSAKISRVHPPSRLGGAPSSISKHSPQVKHAQTSTTAYPGLVSSGRLSEQYQQLPKLPQQRQHFEAVGANNSSRVGIAPTLEKRQLASEVSGTSSAIDIQRLEQTTSSALDSPPLPPSSSKQLFLPPYLQPDSDVRDLSSLVDELTPIQAELGPCPFKPSDWDERRTELVRRYSAIYGQGNSKRKSEELSLHEQNINMAAFQLCLRDPTLLVRRDELLVLSRKAIKDGGYTFQHGLSKAKVQTSADPLLSVPSISVVRKQPLDTIPSLEEGSPEFSAGVGLTGPLLPPSRNMSREKKLKRVEELEFLITNNKMKQSVKLAALEKARQTNDFSMSHHLQAEIESLGSTLANLQDEYSNMKYRLRRSDRYFEKKRKMEEIMDAEMIRSAQQHPSTGGKTSAKRVRTRPDFSSDEVSIEEQVPVAFYTQPTGHQAGAEKRDTTLTTNALPEEYLSHHSTISSGNSSGDTTVSFSRSYFQVTPATTSTTDPPTSPSSLLHTSSPSPPHNNTHLTYATTAQTSTVQLPSQQERSNSNNRGLEGERGEATPTSGHNRPGGEMLTEQGGGKDLLLADINKLATKAAANLRSLPHF